MVWSIRKLINVEGDAKIFIGAVKLRGWEIQINAESHN